MGVCTWRLGVDLRCLPQDSLSTAVFEAGSLTEPAVPQFGSIG